MLVLIKNTFACELHGRSRYRNAAILESRTKPRRAKCSVCVRGKVITELVGDAPLLGYYGDT